MIIQKSKSFKKRTVLIVMVLLLLVGVVVSVIYFNRNDGDIKRDADGISVERTDQDRRLEKSLSDNPEQKSQQTQTDVPVRPKIDQQTQLQRVNAVLTNVRQQADQVNASGFVSNVIEENGNCTYVFTKGETTIEKPSGTLTNASSTTCKTVEFDKNELSPGVWVVHVEYLSPFSSGKSNELELSI